MPFGGADAECSRLFLKCRYRDEVLLLQPSPTTRENALEQLVLEIDREADKIVGDLRIPPCPGVLAKLLKEVRQEEPDYKKASKLISADMVLAVAVLKTVNAPFVGLRTQATSVNQALQLMGLRNTLEIGTGLLLRQAFPVGDNPWRHSGFLGHRRSGRTTGSAANYAP